MLADSPDMSSIRHVCQFKCCAAFRDLLKYRVTEFHLQVTAYLSCISTGLAYQRNGGIDWLSQAKLPG